MEMLNASPSHRVPGRQRGRVRRLEQARCREQEGVDEVLDVRGSRSRSCPRAPRADIVHDTRAQQEVPGPERGARADGEREHAVRTVRGEALLLGDGLSECVDALLHGGA